LEVAKWEQLVLQRPVQVWELPDFPIFVENRGQSSRVGVERPAILEPGHDAHDGPTYDIIFEFGPTSACGGAGTFWKACAALATGSTANKTAAEYQQWWVITLNSAWLWGASSPGRLDIQSVVTNELGHAWYLNHNASWAEGVVQAESCAWGSTTCVDSAGRTVNCANCGSRRTILIGDQSTLDHIYGRQGGGGFAVQGQPSAKVAHAPDTWAVPNRDRPIAAQITAP
jgi:hypothetical protein